MPPLSRDGRGAEQNRQDRAVLSDHVELEIPNHSLRFEFGEIRMEGCPAIGREQIGEVHFPDHLLTRISQPGEFRVVNPDEQAIFVERVIAARGVVIKVEHLLGGLLQRLLRPLPLNRHAEDIGHGLQEVDFVVREFPVVPCVGSHHPIAALAGRDDDAHAAHDAVFVEQRQPAETRFGPKIVHDHRLAGKKGISGLGIRARADGRVADEAFLPANARSKEQTFAVRK